MIVLFLGVQMYKPEKGENSSQHELIIALGCSFDEL
jgi:hypothetical protein